VVIGVVEGSLCMVAVQYEYLGGRNDKGMNNKGVGSQK